MFDLFKIVRTWVDTEQKFVAANALCDGDEADDATATNVDVAHFLHPMGFATLPVVTSTLKAFGWFDAADVVLGWFFDKAKAITDLISGETRVYSIGKITVALSLRADGSARLTSDGGDIVLNGGTLKVARDTDAVNKASLMSAWMGQVETFINGLTPGTITPLSSAGPGFSQIGTISGGAANVKA